MCYPKPGPRCSNSAAATLARAQHDIIKLGNYTNEEQYAVYEKLRDKLEHAQTEYSITPAGLKELERASGDEFSDMRLEAAVNLRQMRLQAVKEELRTEKPHKRRRRVAEFSKQQLSTEGEVLYSVSQEDPKLDNILAESENWVHSLTHDEIDAVRNYTQSNYADVNAYLSNDSWEADMFPEDAERVREEVKLLDSALAKNQTDRDVVVYRRHAFYDNDGGMSEKPLHESITETFIPGTIYKPKFFMSTTLNPAEMPEENDMIAVLEIRSRKAVSVSAAASGSTSEQEFIIPRDTEYRVLSVSRKVELDDAGVKKTLTFIQLDEL
jgi:hypothetical protein